MTGRGSLTLDSSLLVFLEPSIALLPVNGRLMKGHGKREARTKRGRRNHPLGGVPTVFVSSDCRKVMSNVGRYAVSFQSFIRCISSCVANLRSAAGTNHIEVSHPVDVERAAFDP